MKQLLESYGSLLTDKQANFAKSFVVEGKSFSQIAREHQISRQAVHEAVHNVSKTLRFYREKLTGCGRADGQEHTQPLDPKQVTLACEKLHELKVKIAHRGIIYNVDWILHDIDEICELLD